MINYNKFNYYNYFYISHDVIIINGIKDIYIFEIKHAEVSYIFI